MCVCVCVFVCVCVCVCMCVCVCARVRAHMCPNKNETITHLPSTALNHSNSIWSSFNAAAIRLRLSGRLSKLII